MNSSEGGCWALEAATTQRLVINEKTYGCCSYNDPRSVKLCETVVVIYSHEFRCPINSINIPNPVPSQNHMTVCSEQSTATFCPETA
jgi:hypothetical protein